MTMKHKAKKISAVILSAVLAASSFSSIPAYADGETVQISSAEDFAAFSKNCTLDSWSRGKTINLTADISLADTDISPVPIFCGTFNGNGHTISGLDLDGGNSYQGLFRFVAEDGVINGLTVSGTVSADGAQEYVGGIAGSVRGIVRDCSFEGVIDGTMYVGGIAGITEKTGRIENCRVIGMVQGEKYIGGITGRNDGSISASVNHARINPLAGGLSASLEEEAPADVKDTALDRTESTLENARDTAEVSQDTGGIAGFSNGSILNCTNEGAVGYPHVGYNVGGIVGQLEPEVLQTFSEDFLDKLLAQLDTLQDIMDRTANHADSISDSVHAQMSDLTGKVRDTKDIAKELTDAMTDWANGNIDEINELSARISQALDDLADILDDTGSALDALDALLDTLEKVRKDLTGGNDAAEDFQKALTNLRDARDAARETHKAVTSAAKDVLDAIISGKDPQEALDHLKDVLGNYSTALRLVGTALEQMRQALNALPADISRLKKALEDLGDVENAAHKALNRLDQVVRGLEELTRKQADKPEIKIDPIGSDLTEKGSQLQNAMDALLDSGEALNQLLSDSADTLIADLKAINSQFRSITNLIRSEKSDWNQDQSKIKEDQIRDHFQDLSDSCDSVKQHDGRISASENKGEITGSTNLGGIVGSVGIEIDFDPDGDVTKVGDYSLNFHYQTRALLTGCTNSGAVTGRNDYAGGITGQAYIGQITGCQSYGAVSTDGSYVGGIAGRSDSSIRLSWVKCSLSGEDYVGGIAGYGKTLSDCRSLVTVDGGAYTGAIAGDVDEDGSVTSCLFTHETLGAIDGISYARKAEPAAFDALCAGDTVPKTFSQMELTFRADGKEVAVVPFQYGRGIDSLPEIPAKKGFSAVWPDLDYTHLTASQTLDAVYTPYTSSLTDDTQTLPQILVDGSFSSRATVSHTSEPVSWTDAKGSARTGTAVTVTVDDPDMTAISYTVHYRLPEDGKRYDLWVKTENGWEKQDSTVDGSYLLFTSDRETVTFCVQERTASPLLWVLLAVLILLALMLVVIRIRKKRGRQTIRSRLRKARQKKS